MWLWVDRFTPHDIISCTDRIDGIVSGRVSLDMADRDEDKFTELTLVSFWMWSFGRCVRLPVPSGQKKVMVKKIWFYPFLILAVYGGEVLTVRRDRLTPGERAPVTRWMEAGLAVAGFEPLAVQLVAESLYLLRCSGSEGGGNTFLSSVRTCLPNYTA